MAKRHLTIGQKVRFDPFATDMCHNIGEIRCEVVGIIVEIHKGHKWFGVEYGDQKLRTSFKFCEVGKTVILGG